MATKIITPPINMYIELTGISPLLMHSDASVDILNPLVREKKALEKKKNRTSDEEMHILRLDWQLSLYYNEIDGPYIPLRNVKASLWEAAKLRNQGKAVQRGFIPLHSHASLEYRGPRDLEGLWNEGYRDTRSIRNSGMNAGRTIRCRPMFTDWKLAFSATIIQTELDLDVLEESLHRAGTIIGLGDYRPAGTKGGGGEFGRYNVVLTLSE